MYLACVPGEVQLYLSVEEEEVHEEQDCVWGFSILPPFTRVRGSGSFASGLYDGRWSIP